MEAVGAGALGQVEAVPPEHKIPTIFGIITAVLAVVGGVIVPVWNHYSSEKSSSAKSTVNVYNQSGPVTINNAPTADNPGQPIPSAHPEQPVASGVTAAKCNSNYRASGVCVELRTTVEAGPRGDAITTSPNAALAIRIYYVNLGSQEADNVILKLMVPDEFARPLPGSTRIWNSVAPQGGHVDSDDLSKNGVNVGDYGPDGNVWLEQVFTVNDVKRFNCGSSAFVVTAVAALRDSFYQNVATARVERHC